MLADVCWLAIRLTRMQTVERDVNWRGSHRGRVKVRGGAKMRPAGTVQRWSSSDSAAHQHQHQRSGVVLDEELHNSCRTSARDWQYLDPSRAHNHEGPRLARSNRNRNRGLVVQQLLSGKQAAGVGQQGVLACWQLPDRGKQLQRSGRSTATARACCDATRATRQQDESISRGGEGVVGGRRASAAFQAKPADMLTGVHSGWSPALTRAMILRPWPPPRQAAQTVRHVPPQPSQPSPSLRHLRQEHSVCPVPPHMGHALPCAHTGLTRAAGQRLVFVLLWWGEAHAPLRFPRALGATAAPRRRRPLRCTAPTGSPQTGRRRPPRWHGGQQTRRAVPAAVVGAAPRASGAARARGCSCVAGSLRHPRQDAAPSKLSGGHA